MTPDKPLVAVLGGGPAGVGAAWRLARRGFAKVVLVERGDRFGGAAGSFDFEGQRVDFGSHRLHPACDPEILADLKGLLGDDLLDRPRHGRIRLHDRWIRFPLHPVDLLMRAPKRFLFGAARDAALKPMRRRASAEETFASVLERGLGPTICRDFYFPFARKIWGVEPEQLSSTQARRRVSAGSPAKLLRKLASAVPGLRPAGAGRFFYPRKGFGQITEAIAAAAVRAGADLRRRCSVAAIEREGDSVTAIVVETPAGEERIETSFVLSTLPIGLAVKATRPAAPRHVVEAAGRIRSRGMILVYLCLETGRVSEWDAHYLPQPDIPFTRVSEPKNYAATSEPRGRTVLCAELPCSPEDALWRASDETLGELALDSLGKAAIKVDAPLRAVAVRRLPHAYPIYDSGYERNFDALDEWLGSFEGFATFGRQGLFAHDNTHHALAMAYAAVDCLDDDARFDRDRWSEYRRGFESHVVED